MLWCSGQVWPLAHGGRRRVLAAHGSHADFKCSLEPMPRLAVMSATLAACMRYRFRCGSSQGRSPAPFGRTLRRLRTLTAGRVVASDDFLSVPALGDRSVFSEVPAAAGHP